MEVIDEDLVVPNEGGLPVESALPLVPCCQAVFR
jgi:hypothetical protein